MCIHSWRHIHIRAYASARECIRSCTWRTRTRVHRHAYTLTRVGPTTYAHTHPRMNTHACARTRANALTHACVRTHTRYAHARRHMHSCARTMRMHAYARARANTHIHAHALVQAHTHIFLLRASRLRPYSSVVSCVSEDLVSVWLFVLVSSGLLGLTLSAALRLDLISVQAGRPFVPPRSGSRGPRPGSARKSKTARPPHRSDSNTARPYALHFIPLYCTHMSTSPAVTPQDKVVWPRCHSWLMPVGVGGHVSAFSYMERQTNN